MKRFIYFLFAALVMASCNPDTIDFSGAAQDESKLAIEPDEVPDKDTLTLINDIETPIVYADLGTSKTMPVKVQVPVVPDEYIEPAGLIEQFRDLAKFTNGQETYVDAAREVTAKCIGILDTHLVDNSDVVFLIDATQSMEDDIANVKRGVTTIIEHVRLRENVRVGVAIYRDVQDRGAVWYDYLQLTNEFDSVIAYVNAISPCCGYSDWAESVYDGACVTLDSMHWREDSPKMMLLIGDAPAKQGKYSQNTLEDVVHKSRQHGVQMNFYPVIITTEIAIWNPTAVKPDFFTKMYPNPTAGELTLEMNFTANYSWTVVDMGGNSLMQGVQFGKTLRLDLSDLPNGAYNVQVTKDGLTQNKLIVVAH